jgi:hypothetical protein
MRYVNAVHRAVVVRLGLGILLTGCAEGASPGGGDDAADAAAGIDAAPGTPDGPPGTPDGPSPPSDARAADAFTGPATFEFQDGAEPTAAYAGTRDTQLRESEPGTVFGSRTGIEMDGDSPDGTGQHVHALVRWDISAIPAGARVTRVRVALQALDWPGFINGYELRPLRRDWDEAAANWSTAKAGEAWQTVGAMGTSDHARNLVLGQLMPGGNGPFTIQLNDDGVAEVQTWIDVPAANFGVIIYDTASDGMEIATRESTNVGHRPRLIIDVE